MFNDTSSPKFQTLRVIFALMAREMTTRYGRSWGGYFWAIAEPVGMIAILSLAFSQIVQAPPLGNSFMLFYATGFIPFLFFTNLAEQGSSAVQLNKNLMYFPMVTPIDAVIARCTLAVLTMIVVSLFVFVGIFLIIPEPATISLPEIVMSYLAASVLGLGVGTLNAVLFSFFGAWRNIWLIINRPLFIISGIFFTYESMPENLRILLYWNPLIHVVGEARQGFYPIYDGSYVQIAYPLGLGVFCFLLGGALLIRHRSTIVENA